MNKITKAWLIKRRLHILIWAIFIIYESIIVGLVFGSFGNPLTYAAHYTIIIILFYSHADQGMPWALQNSRNAVIRVPLMIAFEVALFVLASFCIDWLLIQSHVLIYGEPFTLSYKYGLKTLYRGAYFMLFSTGYFYLLTYNKEKKKTAELEKQRLNDIIYKQKAEQELTKAQNAFLKAQINPHFLFNTLDFVYHNILSLSPVAADAVITLAEMMRYAIDSDKMGDFVRLGDEIEQVENLLYLNQLRKSERLHFNLKYAPAVVNIDVIPLVLLTLVENIFKHANLTQPEHEAFVNIDLRDGLLIMETDNLINTPHKIFQTQTGLKNTEKRLKYAYGDQVYFAYSKDNLNHFKLEIRIPFNRPGSPGVFSPISKGSDTTRLHGHVDQK